MDSKNAVSATWDEVAKQYSVTIDDGEYELANDIIAVLKKHGIARGSRLLELGCGSGHLSACLNMAGYQTDLLDFSPESLKKASQTFEQYGLHGNFIQGDIMHLDAFQENDYDLVWNSGVMEHFADDTIFEAFRNIRKIARRSIFVAVPNPISVSYLLMRYIRQSQQDWPYGREYLRSDYDKAIKAAGFEDVSVCYLGKAATGYNFYFAMKDAEFCDSYADMLERGLLPEHENYLTGYFASIASRRLLSDELSEDAPSFDAESITGIYELNAERYGLAKQLSKVRETLGEAAAREQEHIANIAETESERKKLENELEYANADCRRLRSELEDSNIDRQQLKNQLESSNIYRQQLKSQLESSNIDRQQLKSQLESSNIDRQQLKSQLESSNIDRQQLKSQLESSNIDHQQLKSELEHAATEHNQALNKLGNELKITNTERLHLRDKLESERGNAQQIIINAFNATDRLFKMRIFKMLHLLSRIINQLIKGGWAEKKGFFRWLCAHIMRRPYSDRGYNPLQMITDALSGEHTHSKYIQTSYKDDYKSEYTSTSSDSDISDVSSWEFFGAEPLISVMIPVYNHAGLISAAIDSVRDQTYRNWELIILDDGSEDNLEEVLEQYSGDPRISVYKQKNQKLPTALTHLHSLANGEFLTWTSADNIMLPDMLKALASSLLENIDCSLVYADVAVIDEHGDYYTGEYRDRERDPERPYIIRLPRDASALGAEPDNFINACFLYRREASGALGGRYSSDLEGLEDYDYWLRMSRTGKVMHIGNNEPLYLYRVHKNTMSEDLLKNKQEQHFARAKKLIRFEGKRAEFSKKPWQIEIKCDSVSLMVDSYVFSDKKIAIYSDKSDVGETAGTELPVVYDGHNFNITFKNTSLSIATGANVNPLCVKARYIKPDLPYWEYTAMGGRKVIGIHSDIALINVDEFSKIISRNDDCFFVLCDTSDGSDKAKRLASKFENCVYVGKRELGEPYYMYSSWDAIMLPPVENEFGKYNFVEERVLAWSCGLWLMYPGSLVNFEAMPCCCAYYQNDKLPKVWKFASPRSNVKLINSYIDEFSVEGRIRKLCGLCNAITEEHWLDRPPFSKYAIQEELPAKVEKYANSFIPAGYIGFMVDTLDKGGLEQVTALLAIRMKDRGLPVKILCTSSGGAVADQVAADGIEVAVFDGDRDRIVRYLKDNVPDVISSHYVQNFYDVPRSLGIPVVETIHNMYAYFDYNDWKREAVRSKCFDAMIAVSDTVKEYYLRHNPSYGRNIEVVGNAADIRRTGSETGRLFRRSFDILPNKFVFLNVASFDGRKNHFGLLSAFEQFYKAVGNDAVLLIAGNILDSKYYGRVIEYIDTLHCKSNVVCLDYIDRIGEVLNMADAFVIPSFIEGWSIAATEAAYAGLPVIHSNCGSGRELCGPDNEYGALISHPLGGLENINRENINSAIYEAEQKNTRELVDAMAVMYNNKEIWSKKRPSVRARALCEFNVDRMVDGYLRVLEAR